MGYYPTRRRWFGVISTVCMGYKPGTNTEVHVYYHRPLSMDAHIHVRTNTDYTKQCIPNNKQAAQSVYSIERGVKWALSAVVHSRMRLTHSIQHVSPIRTLVAYLHCILAPGFLPMSQPHPIQVKPCCSEGSSSRYATDSCYLCRLNSVPTAFFNCA